MRTDRRTPRGWEILALTALAIAQPLFDLLSRQSAFFVAHQSRPAQIVAFTAVVYLAIPLAILAVVWSIDRVAPRLASGAHDLLVVTLIGLILLAPAKRLGLSAATTIAVALPFAVGGALALRRSKRLRNFVVVLAVLSLAIPVHFLVLSPVAKLIRVETVETARVEVGNPVPVVMLILDELPLVSLLDADHRIDATLYPGFAELARRSHWFRNATAVSPLTDFAVPALLTGVRPRDVAPIAAEYPQSLFTLLGRSHQLEVIETQTRLCPPELCAGASTESAAGLGTLLGDAAVVYLHIVTPEPLASRLPSIATAWGGFLDGERRARVDSTEPPGSTSDPVKYHIWASDRERDFDRFLDGLRPGAQSILHFFHAMLPHVPWVHLPSGREYWGSLYSASHTPGVAADTTWTTEAWLVERAWQRHLAQVAYVDSLIGRLLQRLDESGLADEALLVVVSDHGFSFRPGTPGRHPTPQNFADIMSVPLFVRLPGQTEGSISDRNVETIDVLPTIADVLEIEPPSPFDGDSAFSTAPERRTKTIAPTPSERLTFETAELDLKYDSVDRKLEIFSDGLFGIGPHPELLGRPLAEYPVGAPIAFEVRLDQAEHYRDVDPAGHFLPAQIFGRIRRDDDGDRDMTLAIAVNGVVRAVTRTFMERGQERFVTLVPEESFRPGANTVEVLTVDGTTGTPALRRTNLNSTPTYAIELDATGRPARLVASDGSVCALDAAAVEGAFARQGTGFLGWAVDASGARPNAIIMVFTDGRLAYTTSTGVRPATRFSPAKLPGFAQSGFHFTLPAALLEQTDDLRLFAILGERGAELPEALGLQ